MGSPRYDIVGPVEDHGIIVRGARQVRHWVRRAWIASCFGLAVTSFVMVGVMALVFIESLFAEYSVSDMQIRAVLPVLVLFTAGLPAHLILQREQLGSIGRSIRSLLFWERTRNRPREQLLPRWVRHGTWVLGGHAMVNFVLTLLVTLGGYVKEENGHFFAASGGRILHELPPEEAHLWLSFYVSLFAAGYIVFFFGHGFIYWFHRKRLIEKTDMRPVSDGRVAS